MLMQHLKEIVVNRETASYERARNKEKAKFLAAAAIAPGAEGRQVRPAMDVPPSHSEI